MCGFKQADCLYPLHALTDRVWQLRELGDRIWPVREWPVSLKRRWPNRKLTVTYIIHKPCVKRVCFYSKLCLLKAAKIKLSMSMK